MALYSKAVFVALPSAPSPEALLCPVAWFVGCVFVLADQYFALGEMHAWIRLTLSRAANRDSVIETSVFDSLGQFWQFT